MLHILIPEKISAFYFSCSCFSRLARGDKVCGTGLCSAPSPRIDSRSVQSLARSSVWNCHWGHGQSYWTKASANYILQGWSEGQFYQVLLYELDAIRKGLLLILRSATLPSLTSTSAAMPASNRPAHYHVLWDENNFTANALQTLTNNLCYTATAYEDRLIAFCAQVYMEQETSVQRRQAARPDKEPVLMDNTARGIPVALPSSRSWRRRRRTSCITVKKYSRIILLQIYMCL